MSMSRIASRIAARRVGSHGRWVIFKKSRHYVSGPGSDNKVYDDEVQAQVAAAEAARRNPVGFDVLPYRESSSPSGRASGRVRKAGPMDYWMQALAKSVSAAFFGADFAAKLSGIAERERWTDHATLGPLKVSGVEPRPDGVEISATIDVQLDVEGFVGSILRKLGFKQDLGRVLKDREVRRVAAVLLGDLAQQNPQWGQPRSWWNLLEHPDAKALGADTVRDVQVKFDPNIDGGAQQGTLEITALVGVGS